MKLSSMRYKNYTWPHNPKTFVVEYRRQIAAQKVPMGGCILQDLGVNCRILRESCYCQGKAVYQDEGEVLRDLTPREMETLLLRLAEGEALPEERGGTFDLQRFADMKGE